MAASDIVDGLARYSEEKNIEISSVIGGLLL